MIKFQQLYQRGSVLKLIKLFDHYNDLYNRSTMKKIFNQLNPLTNGAKTTLFHGNI